MVGLFQYQGGTQTEASTGIFVLIPVLENSLYLSGMDLE